MLANCLSLFPFSGVNCCGSATKKSLVSLFCDSLGIVQIVVILRGLPGAGKSHVAKIIKVSVCVCVYVCMCETEGERLCRNDVVMQEKETSMGGAAPRILSIDAYFLNEMEKFVKDPDTGRRCMCVLNVHVYPLMSEFSRILS